MSSKSLKGLRTRYRNIIDKEMTDAKTLLAEEITEDIDIKKLLKGVRLCSSRLKEFSEKLENTNEALIEKLEKDGKDDETDALIEEDCSLSSAVCNVLFELSEFENYIRGVIELESKSSVEPSVDIKDVVGLQAEMQKQIKDLIVVQQENIKHQKDTIEARKKEEKSLVSVKLPKINLKNFGGDKLKWLEFWDCFRSTIHDNKRLTGVEKFNYLSSVLHGEAKSVVNGLPLTDDNYQVAVHLLKERYGEPQNVIDSFYTELVNLQPATNKTETLRVLYNKFETNLRSLEALGQDIDQAVFVSILTSKLPKYVLTQLEIQKGAHNKWSVAKLRELLHGYISARERAEQSSSEKEQTSSVKTKTFPATSHKQIRETKPRATAEALFTGAQTHSYKDLCRYCEGRHWSDECKRYKTIDERKKKIKGSCYLCLKDNHKSSDCRSKKTCVHCKAFNQHHRSLCPKKFYKRSGAEMAHPVGEINDPEDRHKETEKVLVSTGEMVLMQTAKTVLKNSDNHDIKETTRIILDSGSQRTYITDALAEKLHLQLGECSEIKLITFGEEKAKTIRTPTANLDIKLSDGAYMNITVNVVPKISGDIVRRPVSVTKDANWKYLFQSFQLADDLPTEIEESSIEMLIGNDYYLDVVLPQRVEIKPGLYLLGSRFGWILTGRTSEKSVKDSEQSLLILNFNVDVKRETSLLTDVDKSLPIKPKLQDFWNLETIGITDPLSNKGDEEALERFDKTVEYEDKRYFVSWPWRSENEELPVNYELAYGRLRTLLKKLKGDQDLMQQYDAIIQDQHSKGMIEKVPPDPGVDKLHYIPHHAVLTPTKTTTKLRLVFDASAKNKGVKQQPE